MALGLRSLLLEDPSEKLFHLARHGTGKQLKEALKLCHKPVDSVRVRLTRRTIIDQGGHGTEHRIPAPPQVLSLLQVACLYGNASCVETLLDLGASPFAVEQDDPRYTQGNLYVYGRGCIAVETLLHLAAVSGSETIVRLLQAAGLDVNSRSVNQYGNRITPLMAAANRYKKLLELDEDQERIQELPSLQQQESKAVIALISLGADMDAHCGEVTCRVYPPQIQIGGVRQIHRGKYETPARVSEGMTALHWAAYTGDYGVAYSLVAAGADVNSRIMSRCSARDKGQTPLHCAVECGNVEIVELLLAGGANVNARDAFSATPLHQVFAVSEFSQAMLCQFMKQPFTEHFLWLKGKRTTIAEVLLRAGADRNAKAIAAEHHPTQKRGWNSCKQEYEVSCEALNHPNTGGIEVMELLSTVWGQPCSLQSTCRLAVRRCLRRPILRRENVEHLPLPSRLKSYISMEAHDLQDV